MEPIVESKPICIITGPTAVGKTAAAALLAKSFNGELVSADSRQVYTHTDIVSGKEKDPYGKSVSSGVSISLPSGTVDLMIHSISGVPLWMYDVVSPDTHFSASDYQMCASQAIVAIQKKGRLPIVVGGTGLYIDTLIRDVIRDQVPSNFEVREQFKDAGYVELQKYLDTLDDTIYESMNDSDKKNPRRLIRKIEIALYKNSHKLKQKQKKSQLFPYHMIGLSLPFPLLYSHIDNRVEKRIHEGAIQEAEIIRDLYGIQCSLFDGLGYSELLLLIEGKMSIEDMGERWKFDEHAYARRQMTWFRKEPSISWIDMQSKDSEKEMKHLMEAWYNK